MTPEKQREFNLKIIKLLSALEAAGLMADEDFPDGLISDLHDVVDVLTDEVLR